TPRHILGESADSMIGHCRVAADAAGAAAGIRAVVPTACIIRLRDREGMTQIIALLPMRRSGRTPFLAARAPQCGRRATSGVYSAAVVSATARRSRVPGRTR